LLDFLSYNI